MSMAFAPARAADDDSEIALISYDTISDMVEIGDDVEVIDTENHGSWTGTVIDVDEELQAFYVKVDPDSFTPREPLHVMEAFDDLDLYENTSDGRLYTLDELVAVAEARRMNPFL